MVTIKNGTLDDFFDSAIESAKEIDKGKEITKKFTIWMDTDDLLQILKPQRTTLLKYLKDKSKVYYSSLLNTLNKSPSSLNRDLELLSKYNLIEIVKEPNSGHGIKKVIKPLYSHEDIEFKAMI